MTLWWWMEITGRPLEELIPVMTENPARMMGMYDSIGSIEVGKDGDLVVLDENNKVFSTYSKGKMQYHI